MVKRKQEQFKVLAAIDENEDWKHEILELFGKVEEIQDSISSDTKADMD